MKSKWWLVPVVLALIGVLWISTSDHPRLEPLRAAIGLKPASVERAKSKPICSQVIVPAGDCIPQYMANLPPDPGPAGDLTIEGVDSNGDGLRDDVHRKLAERYGHSPLAMAVLTRVALSAQLAVKHGGDLSQDEALKLAPVLTNAGFCYAAAAPQSVQDDGGLEKAQAFVINTFERTQRLRAFDRNFHGYGWELPDATFTVEACGFDPAAFPN